MSTLKGVEQKPILVNEGLQPSLLTAAENLASSPTLRPLSSQLPSQNIKSQATTQATPQATPQTTPQTNPQQPIGNRSSQNLSPNLCAVGMSPQQGLPGSVATLQGIPVVSTQNSNQVSGIIAHFFNGNVFIDCL